MDYEKLLEIGMKKMPKRAENGDRFVVPKLEIEISGRKTIILNLQEVASALRRDYNHLTKFLLKELATKGDWDGKRIVVLGTFGKEMINKKLELYMKLYLHCPDCKKPDTELVKDGKSYSLKCEACGARHPVKK